MDETKLVFSPLSYPFIARNPFNEEQLFEEFIAIRRGYDGPVVAFVPNNQQALDFARYLIWLFADEIRRMELFKQKRERKLNAQHHRSLQRMPFGDRFPNIKNCNKPIEKDKLNGKLNTIRYATSNAVWFNDSWFRCQGTARLMSDGRVIEKEPRSLEVVSDFAGFSEYQMLRMRNVGRKTVANLVEYLSSIKAD